MTLDLNCLSLMELLELREGADDPVAREHLEECPRCRALLATLPSDLELGTPSPSGAVLSDSARTRPPASGQLRTGSLWRAVPEADADFAWVVAVIGKSPQADDQLLVAPVAGPLALATHADLLLDTFALGYDAFVDMANLGTLLRDQLLEPLGRLQRSQAEALVGLYRHVLAGAPAPAGAPRGLPVLDERDPRLLEQAARAEALRALWRPALRQVDADDPDVAAGRPASGALEAAPARSPAEPVPALAAVLSGHLEGPEAEWDRASLLEQTGIDGGHLSGFLTNRLQLTDKTDVPDLARVIHALGLPWQQAEPAVAAALAVSTGGARSAEGPTLPMAARSRAGADQQATTRDLYADQSSVDTSERARQREIVLYLAGLRRELDELE